MSKKTKVGVIGTGSIAQGKHIPAYLKHPDAEIFAVCDIKPDVLEKVGSELGLKHRYLDYNDLLKIDEIDMVDICTPNYAHAAPAVAALKAGKHVIVEKPIAINATEGAAMVKAEKESGKKLMVALCRRYESGVRALKRFIEAGDMGEIYYARVQALRRRGIPSWGVFTQKDKQGGGPLIDIGVHMLDLTLWLMGHPKPVAASGFSYTKFGTRPGLVGTYGTWDYKNYTVEDFAGGLVRFENGASLTVETSFAANIEHDYLNSVILGTEGGCEYNPLKMYKEERQTLLDVTPVFLPKVDVHEAEIFDFIDCVRNDRPVLIPGEEGLVVSKIMDAIYKSAEEGKEVLIK